MNFLPSADGKSADSIVYFGPRNPFTRSGTIIRENPVRAGLVEHWKQWPYRHGFFDDE
jgi:hypothetical protein